MIDMTDEWMVRVQGKEYGPVDVETLREWQREGRFIRTNEVRRPDDERWIMADQIVELFSDVEQTEDPVAVHFRRRTLAEIVFESFRIYRRGFIQFFVLSLLVSVPSFFMQWALSYVNLQTAAAPSMQTRIATLCGLVTLVVWLMAWPVFVAGIQIATADLDAGKKIPLRDLLRRALSLWAPTAKLSLFVYGSYFFWTAIPLLAMLSLLGGELSILSILLVLLTLAVQVYMTARLWVNFMFWQQTSVLEHRDGIEALRESKTLARSRRDQPWLARPLARGAILVSIWLLVLIAVSSSAEMPFVLMRLQGVNVTNMDDVTTLWQNLTAAHAPDALTIIGSAMSTLVHALLRPLLGISFVLLYFDARTDFAGDKIDNN
jgi:hypothetical protein